MIKFVEFLEKNTAIRLITIMAMFIGLIVAFPTIYGWFQNTPNIVKQPTSAKDTGEIVKNYFIPTHLVGNLKKKDFINVISRPLLQSEIKQISEATLESKVIDANLTIGHLTYKKAIRLLKHDGNFFKIQYWDETKVVVGYVPDTIPISRIIPIQNNKYGPGNGKLILYTYNSIGIEDIQIDEESFGALLSYISNQISPTCENSEGLKSLTFQYGEHIINATYSNGITISKHFTLHDEECLVIDLSYD